MSPPAHYDASAPSEQPLPAVPTPVERIASDCEFLAPRTRRGRGPGVLAIFAPPQGARRAVGVVELSVHVKLAEEGFAVVAACPEDASGVEDLLRVGAEKLAVHETVEPKGKIALLVAGDRALLDISLSLLGHYPQIACMIAYDNAPPPTALPTLAHLSVAPATPPAENVTTHVYAGTQHEFYDPHTAPFKPGPAAQSHTRTVEFLKKHLGGPYFDLESIWEEHCRYEFEERSVAKCMGTMVEEPYVNHIPTMTGGIGRKKLTVFYRDNFIFSNPRDARLELISRTVGSDRIVDEFIFHMTHDTAIDWLLPGVPPTGKTLAIPMVAIVNVRGDRLAHEHIMWDQAGALLQAGLLPEKVQMPGGTTLRLPVAGVAAARLAVDETDGTSNEMLTQAWQQASWAKQMSLALGGDSTVQLAFSIILQYMYKQRV